MNNKLTIEKDTKAFYGGGGYLQCFSINIAEITGYQVQNNEVVFLPYTVTQKLTLNGSTI